MKNYLPFIIGLVILVVPFVLMGCETVTPAGTAPAFVNTETYNAGINALQAQIATKADAATVAAQTARIDAIASQGAGNTYSKGELYTRAEVDAAIAAAVAALKANQTWITGSTGGTTGGTVAGGYGELIDTDGDLELWLDKVSGIATDELRTTLANDQMARFDFVVVNKDASSAHDFKINLMFYPNTAATLDMIDVTHGTRVSTSGGLTYTVSRDQVTPAPPNTNPLSLYQGNTGRILKGDAEDYTVWVYISQDSAAAVDWDWTITIDDRD